MEMTKKIKTTSSFSQNNNQVYSKEESIICSKRHFTFSQVLLPQWEPTLNSEWGGGPRGQEKSLYFALYNYQFQKLQHIQNAAARLIRKRFDHRSDMTPILFDLHWLPLKVRVEYKIVCVILKLIHHGKSAPRYLSELISIYVSHICTRSCVGVKLNFSL